jgi:hypothetical protein
MKNIYKILIYNLYGEEYGELRLSEHKHSNTFSSVKILEDEICSSTVPSNYLGWLKIPIPIALKNMANTKIMIEASFNLANK